MVGYGWGMTCVYIKAFGLCPFPHQEKSVLKTCRANMPQVRWREHYNAIDHFIPYLCHEYIELEHAQLKRSAHGMMWLAYSGFI